MCQTHTTPGEGKDEKKENLPLPEIKITEVKDPASVSLPEFPLELDLNDLYPNGKLYPDEIMQFLENHFKKNGLYNKHDIAKALREHKFPETISIKGSDKTITIKDIDEKGYGIIVEEGVILLKYKGLTRGEKEHIDERSYVAGIGSSCIVKFLQNTQTNKFETDKILFITPLADFNISHARKVAISQQCYPSRKKKVERIHIRMKYLPHFDVSTFVKNQCSGFSPIHFFKLIVGMARECASLMQQGILHRDIKGDNFRYNLLTGEVTIMDFGKSHQSDRRITPSWRASLPCFSNNPYIAPEVSLSSFSHVSRHTFHSEANDVYSLGVLLLSFYNKSPDRISFKEIANIANAAESNKYKSIEPFPKVYLMIKRMLSFNPMDRPSFEECYRLFLDEEHHYLRSHSFPQRRIEINDMFHWTAEQFATLHNVPVELINSTGKIFSPNELASIERNLIINHAILFPVIPSSYIPMSSYAVDFSKVNSRSSTSSKGFFSKTKFLSDENAPMNPQYKNIWLRLLEEQKKCFVIDEFNIYTHLMDELVSYSAFGGKLNKTKLLSDLTFIKKEIDGIKPGKCNLKDFINAIKNWSSSTQFLAIFYIVLTYPSTTELNLLEQIDNFSQLLKPTSLQQLLKDYLRKIAPDLIESHDFDNILPLFCHQGYFGHFYRDYSGPTFLKQEIIKFATAKQLNLESIQWTSYLTEQSGQREYLTNLVRSYLQESPATATATATATAKLA